MDSFSAGNPDVRFEDWLPTLKRASEWNRWSEEESLLQLAGHLRGKALQEWNLLDKEQKVSFQSAVEAIRRRIDPHNRVIAATDFRHASQAEGESVADYIRRIERLFQLAYGGDSLTCETRDTMLHGQLHGGLRYDVVKSPAVSGAQSYQELCLAARQEEKRVAELRRRQLYTSSTRSTSSTKTQGGFQQSSTQKQPISRRCYLCDSPDHLARQCKARKTESRYFQPTKPAGTKSVRSEQNDAMITEEAEDPRQYLYSSDEDGEVGQIRVEDRGSKFRAVPVQVQGVPAKGVIDTGADINIIGADLFRQVATVNRLRKRELKNPDKIPHTYDQRPFKLHGKIMLDITFLDRTIHTPVYVKMDSPEQLLLSEGVCRQLGIVSYHPSLGIEPVKAAGSEGTPSGCAVVV